MALSQSQIAGLNAAYTRKTQGTANATDLANLDYGMKQGYKPPTAPSAPAAPAPSAPTPSSSSGSGFTSNDPLVQSQLAEMQKKTQALSTYAGKTMPSTPSAPSSPTPSAPTPPPPPAQPSSYTPPSKVLISVPRNGTIDSMRGDFEDIEAVGDHMNPKYYGVKIPKATVINQQGNRVVVRTDNKQGTSIPTAQEYFAKGYVLETAPGVYKDPTSGKTTGFGAVQQTPKPPAPPPSPVASSSSGGGGGLPSGYVKIPGTYATTAAQRAAFDDIRVMGTLGQPGSYLYGRPKSGTLVPEDGQSGDSDSGGGYVAPPDPSLSGGAPTPPPADPLFDLIKGYLGQNVVGPDQATEVYNAPEDREDISGKEFEAALTKQILDRQKQIDAIQEMLLKGLEPSAEETTTSKALDDLIATQRNISASEELGINEIKKQPIAMSFLSGQSAAVQRDAASKINAISAQSEPLKAKLAQLQAKRQAALDVGKQQLAFEQQSFQDFQNLTKPMDVGGSLVRYNPTSGKYETVYSGAKNAAPISVAPGSTLVDPTTGKPIYTNPAKDATQTTNDIKEYEYAKSQGYKGGFQDWLKVSANLKDQASGGGFKSETDLRKEFNSLDAVKQYVDLRRSFLAMNSALNEAFSKKDNESKAAADQALVTLYNKMLDPSSVVREGEYARSFEGQSALSRIVGYMEQIRRGGAGLTDANRADMVQVAQRLFNDSQSIYTMNSDFYKNIATSYGLDPGRIIMDPAMVGGSTSYSSPSLGGLDVNATATRYGVPASDITQLQSAGFSPDDIIKFLEMKSSGKAVAPTPPAGGAGAGVGTPTKDLSRVFGNSPIQATINDIDKIVRAIGQYESGGNYKALGRVTASGDRAYGKYQVMGNNIPSWTKEVLGYSMTPQQFLNNPQAQDAVARAKMSQTLQRYGTVDDVASIWFSGRPAAGNNAQDINGTSTPAYLSATKAIYSRL